jgi:hypothetical protein
MEIKNMFKHYRLLGVLFLLASSPLFARTLHLELQGFAGYGNGVLGSETSSPSLGQFGAAATVGWMPFNETIGIGATSSFRFVNQYSDVDLVIGNRRGKLFVPIAPTLLISLGSWLIAGDYYLMGDYEQSVVGLTGSLTSYLNMKGFRARVAYSVTMNWMFGLYYERLSSDQQQVGTVTTTLTESFVLTQYGATLSYRF